VATSGSDRGMGHVGHMGVGYVRHVSTSGCHVGVVLMRTDGTFKR